MCSFCVCACVRVVVCFGLLCVVLFLHVSFIVVCLFCVFVRLVGCVFCLCVCEFGLGSSCLLGFVCVVVCDVSFLCVACVCVRLVCCVVFVWNDACWFDVGWC